MKVPLFLSAFLSMGLIGYVLGHTSTAQASPQVMIPEFVITLTPTAAPIEPVNTSTPTAQAAVVMQFVQDTPAPVYVQPAQVEEIIEIVLVYDAPMQDVVIEPQPTETMDLSEWIIPLYPTDQPAQIVEPTAIIVPTQAPPIIPLDPMSLDDAWDTVVSLGMDDRFPACIYPLPLPFVDWSMALEASASQTPDRTYTEIKIAAADIARIVSRGGGWFPADGIVQINEDGVQPLIAPLYYNGSIRVCRDANNKPNLYGAGIQSFLDLLSSGYRYE